MCVSIDIDENSFRESWCDFSTKIILSENFHNFQCELFVQNSFSLYTKLVHKKHYILKITCKVMKRWSLPITRTWWLHTPSGRKTSRGKLILGTSLIDGWRPVKPVSFWIRFRSFFRGSFSDRRPRTFRIRNLNLNSEFEIWIWIPNLKSEFEHKTSIFYDLNSEFEIWISNSEI